MKPILPAFFFVVFLSAGCASLNEPEVPVPTLDQIVALAKEGKDASAIIEEIRRSRAIYDLAASQYAKLSRDGVPDAVLDFMQRGQLRLAERHGRREAYNDLWWSSRGYLGWGYGRAWVPRPYFIHKDGKSIEKSY